jgi:hypothetical protein
MIQKLKGILVKTLDFVKDGLILGGKVYIYVMDYITHVGDHQYCGRFYRYVDRFKTC